MLPEGWIRSTVGDACSIKNNCRLPLSSEERASMQGPFPYFGPTGVLDHIDHHRIDEEFALVGEDGDHFLKFRDRKMTLFFSGKANVNNHAHIIGNSELCLAKWFYYWFMHRDITSVLSRQGVARYKLTKAGLEAIGIWLPEIEEQSQICKLLDVWEDSIVSSEKVLENSRKQKKSLLSDVLAGSKRLKEFSKKTKQQPTPNGRIPPDWRYVKVEEVASEVSLKNAGLMAAPVLSCTKHAGLVDSLDYFKKQVFSKDLSTYKVVPRNCFVYATNHIEEGSIGHQDLYDAGLVSPMYTVFKTTADVDDRYLYRLLKTEHFRQIFQAATNASVDRRGSLRWKDFKKLHLPLPPLKEQAAIADIVDTLDREIELLQKQLEALKAEKIALMQQLLTGKRRVTLPATVKPPSAKPKSAKPTAVRDRRK